MQGTQDTSFNTTYLIILQNDLDLKEWVWPRFTIAIDGSGEFV